MMPSGNQSVHRHYPSFRSLPFWLFVGLFSLILALFFTHPWLMRYEINQAKADSLQRLGAYKTSLLATIDRHLYLPRVLASDPRIVNSLGALEDGEAPSSDGFPTSRLLERINRKAGSDEIFLMDPDGTTHYSSNYGTEDSFVGMNYGYRPYFRDALGGVPGFYFAVGATSGIPGLFLSAPVYSEYDTPLGVIVVKIDLRKLEQSWKASGDAVWVTDKRGIIFLASSARWHYTTLQPLSNEVKSELAETRQYGNGPVTPLERVTEWQSDDWSTLDLDAGGPQLVFGSSIPGYPWQMHHRMPQCDRTAIGVHFGGVEPERFVHRQCLCCKGLVRLDQVKIPDGHIDALQQLLHRRNRTNAHYLGPHARMGISQNACLGFQTRLLRRLTGRQHQCCRAIVDPRRVPRRDTAILLKHRAQACERFH